MIDLGWGYAVLQREFPHSHYHNRIVVTSAAPPADVLAAADEVLGGASLRHRYVSVDDDALGRRVASSFVAAGYEHEPIVTMIYCGVEVTSPEHDVQEFSLEALRPAIIRQWRFALPDAPDNEIAQLTDRTALYSRGAELTLLAVHDGNEIAGHAELYVDRTARIAQFESLVAHEGYGGRGYGTALVRDALRRAREAGCDLAFLTANRNEWPVDWYRRLGFVDAGQTHQFSKNDWARATRGSDSSRPGWSRPVLSHPCRPEVDDRSRPHQPADAGGDLPTVLCARRCERLAQGLEVAVVVDEVRVRRPYSVPVPPDRRRVGRHRSVARCSAVLAQVE